MSLKDIFYAVLSVLLWALNIWAQTIAAQEISPFLLSFLRIGLFVPLVLIFPKPPSNNGWQYMAAGLFWNAFNFIFLNLGWKLGVGVAVSSFIIQTNVFFSILLCFLLLNERPRFYQVAGIIIASVGITLLAQTKDSSAGQNSLLGMGLILLASLSWGTGYALLKKFRIGSTMADITWISFYASLPLLVMTLIFDGPAKIYQQLFLLSLKGWFCILYAFLCSSIIAGRLWLYLTKKYSSAYVVPYLLLIPIFATLVATTLNHEVLTPMQIGAGSLILLGVFISQVAPYLNFKRYKDQGSQ
jgi:O-acetylserine/cysteine efflux transporter